MSNLKYTPAYTLLIFFLCLKPSFGNNLEITNVTYDEVANTLNFDISWDNAFYINNEWNDHIYIFAKYKNANGSSWERVLFEVLGHTDDDVDMTVTAPASAAIVDGKKVALKVGHTNNFSSGTQGGNCTVQLADNNNFFHPSFKVFGIEMVKIAISGNDYYIGDGTSENRFHKGSDTTEAFFWEYDPNGSVNVGTGPNDINTVHPDGIPVASISSNIINPPTNIMKYEISQIQYVEFLNCLNRTAQNNLVNEDVSGTSITDVFVMTQTSTVAPWTRNGVRCDSILPNGGPITFYCDYNDNGVPNEYDDGQNIAINYLSGSRLYAYLDWAGLEPLNELQYEHICRGSYNPVPNEFAWGTSGYTNAIINTGSTNGSPDEFLNGAPLTGPARSSQLPMRCGAAATATTNRVTSGASAYGIMELTGNVAELVISLTSSTSFDFLSSGDGEIDNFGESDESWPLYITHKGGFISNDIHSVSFRNENTIPYSSSSAFYGGRGGY